MIRVVLPYHLRNLLRVGDELQVEVESPVTLGALLDAIEATHPALRGTIREHGTLQRRPLIRYFACKDDLSHEAPDTPPPEAVTGGSEPFLIIGAMAGG